MIESFFQTLFSMMDGLFEILRWTVAFPHALVEAPPPLLLFLPPANRVSLERFQHFHKPTRVTIDHEEMKKQHRLHSE
jgi:hypothetical protein